MMEFFERQKEIEEAVSMAYSALDDDEYRDDDEYLDDEEEDEQWQ